MAAERLGELVAGHALASPDAPAVTDADVQLNYAMLAARQQGLAAALARDGIGPGVVVAAWLPNGADYLTAIFAVARLGALLVHVNTRYGDAEVGDVLERTGARVLITRVAFTPVDFLGVLRRVPAGRLGQLKTILVAGDAPCPPRMGGAEVRPLSYAGETPDRSSPSNLCLTFTTSGTTSRPKLVAHTHRSITHHACDVAERVGLTRPGAALLAAVPFCGTFGNVAAMAALAGGAHLVCMEVFEPQAADRLIRRHRVTHLVGDDRMLGRLARTALEGEGPHGTVAFFGVAAFHPDAEASCRLGVDAGLKPHAIYGSSEVQALFAIGEEENGGFGPVHPTSLDARVQVEGPGGTGAGARGELRVAGPSLFNGYLNDEGASDGGPTGFLFSTGDLAEADGAGFTFQGRLGDTLRLGGFLVAPGEIEAFLQAQPGVDAAAVVGAEQDGRPCAFAFVIPSAAGATSEAELLEVCRAHLARYKTPAGVALVDALPYSDGPNGPKISRATLRRQALERLDRDGGGEVRGRMTANKALT